MFEIDEYPKEEVELKFKILLPDHQSRLKNLVEADDMRSALYDVWQKCRDVLRYEDGSAEVDALAEEIQDLTSEYIEW